MSELPTQMDSESLLQRQAESLEALEARLEYLTEVLLWIGDMYANNSGHRAIGEGSPQRPKPAPWQRESST